MFIEGKISMSEEKSGWKSKFSSLESTIKTKIEQTEEEVKKRADPKSTSTPEKIAFQMWGWFWALIIGCFVLFLFVLITLTNPDFWLTGILAIIAIPFWVFICLRNMIPEIKIFGFTIYSRKHLSLRQQLSVGGTIAKFFTKEFFRENPFAALSIVFFTVMFLLSIVLAVNA